MSLLKKLKGNGSLLSRNGGITPLKFDDPQSKLHYSYSITGAPTMKNLPKPSSLDLDGKTPTKYLDTFTEK